MISKNAIRKKYLSINHSLNEKSRRLWCAAEALAIGRGGVTLVYAATKVSRPTIYKGMREIRRKRHARKMRHHIRKKGGGAKLISSKIPEVVSKLEILVEASTKGDPEVPLRWTNKGLRKLSNELTNRAIRLVLLQ